MGCGTVSKIENSHQLQTYSKTESEVRKKNDIIDVEDVENIGNGQISTDVEVLKMVDSMLKTAATDQRKLAALIMKADYTYKQGCKLLNESNLDYFKAFRQTLDNYEKAYTLNEQSMVAIVGITKCLMHLCQYQKALDFLNNQKNSPELIKFSEFWKLKGICLRKISKIWKYQNGSNFNKNFKNLEKAIACLKTSLSLKPSDEQAKKELKFAKNLISLQTTHGNNLKKFLSDASEQKVSYANAVTKSPNNSGKELYKILSIDGGVVFGILPSLVLLEIEKRSNRYLTDLFDMFAGTSTGAVLAAGLTQPLGDGSTLPLYNVADLIKTQLEDADTLLANSGNFTRFFSSQKYSSENLKNVYSKLFKDVLISQSLKDLIIPAVNCQKPLHTVYFNSYDSRKNPDIDIRVFDAVMASSSAPSFFPAYKIKNRGVFIDGAITTRSPSKHAYDEVIERFGKDKSNVFLLSMGTGVLATDLYPEYDNASQSFLPWSTSKPILKIMDQVNYADKYLTSELGSRYKRFEVYLENDMPIDEAIYVTDLLDIGTEYVEENSDEINRIVEILLT
jgi:tetratricopeptide (TPR) repeat protein